ncbi:Hypothetical predicted protein [Olea europaea subsp. europaea]|uniref:Aminotransferase-like plant mobile domain-containing protein n=1 Tax=Olea europaea subsp. europaea TaxID=158383 RepID=A0A8S0TGT5_OLEEU|nr:Hypothetical predicted protein [Olea europaea subsp. europaea]
MEGPSEENLIMEVREEEMISPAGGVKSIRIAYFLRPSVTSIDGHVFDPPVDSVNPTMVDNPVPLKAKFVGWRYPKKDWKKWVYRMQSLHHSTWKQAGIHDAIINSTFKIHRSDDLILGVAEKWCSKTNTFVFPWGEATITLEDMMFLGGFSVLGDSVLAPPGDGEETIRKLHEARSHIIVGKVQRASQCAWMRKFMDSESEIEHEAFLAYWLSRYVFPCGHDLVLGTVFPISVHLVRETKIALAPAVLASIYKNLSLLQEAIVASRKLGTREGQKEVLKVQVTAPFQLVQAWVWERFPTLSPKSNSVRCGEPRLAIWHGLKKMEMENVLAAIDHAEESFIWRPYMRALNNSLLDMVYKEKDYWIFVESFLGDKFEGLVRCLRTSELVSLDADCIEQYLPHRVAMQFGMDQDLPGCVARVNGSSDVAWSNYTRTIVDSILYIPARLFESDVTTRYMKWWKKLKFARSGTTKAGKDGKSASRSSKREKLEGLLKSNLEDDNLAPPGFPPKSNTVKAGVSGIKDKDMVGKKFQVESIQIILPRKDPQRKSTLSSYDFHGHGICERSERKLMESLSGTKSDTDALVPPPSGFSPKRARVEAENFGVEDKETGVEVLEGESSENRSEGHAKSCSLTNPEAAGMRLEERICTIEKLCAWLKAGNHCLDDIITLQDC